MDTILPCPFCGETPAINTLDGPQGERSIEVTHDSNRCILAWMRFHPDDWNRRPQPSAPVQPVARDWRCNIDWPQISEIVAEVVENYELECEGGAVRKITEDEKTIAIEGIADLIDNEEFRRVYAGASPSAQPQPEEAVEQDGPQSVAERPFDRRTTRIMAIADELDEEGRYNQASSIRSVALERDELATKISTPTAPEPSVAAESWMDACMRAGYWDITKAKSYDAYIHGPHAKAFKAGFTAAHPGIVPGWVSEDTKHGKMLRYCVHNDYSHFVYPADAECPYLAAPKGQP